MPTPPTTGFEFGDVVLVEFPFTSQIQSKIRPAVVVSSALYNRSRPDLVLMGITSQVRPSLAFGELLIAGWQTAGLLGPAVVKPLFSTVAKSLIRKSLGRLEDSDRDVLEISVRNLLSAS